MDICVWSLRKVNESNVTRDRLRFILQLYSLETMCQNDI